MPSTDPVQVLQDTALGFGEWLFVIFGLGVSLWMAGKFVIWLWYLLQDLSMSQADWDREARAAGYKDADDRARDHW